MINIKIYNCHNDTTIFNTKNWIEYTDEVRKMLENQISQKIDIFDYGKGHCPSCKTDIHGIGRIKYCFNCGQKLEWR